MKRRFTQSRIYDNMIRAGNTKNRPEQLLAADIIRAHTSFDVQTEVTLNLKATDSVNLTGERAPKVDILLTPHSLSRYMTEQKIVIRCMGAIHKQKRRQNYDRVQRHFMTDNNIAVYDFWYDKMPYLFKDKNRVRFSDREEMALAYNEIRTELSLLAMRKFNYQAILAQQKLTQSHNNNR